MARILLLMATRTYRTRAFLRAARRLGAEVVVGMERTAALARAKPGSTLLVDIRRPERAVDQISKAAEERPFDAIVGVDDDTTLIAALASRALSLAHNDPDAVRATRDKLLMRRLLAAAGVHAPWFEAVPLDGDLAEVAARVAYPCVVKPLFLSASRGVIRADSPAAFLAAAERVRAILSDPEVAAAGGALASQLLVESFIPGGEVALEGLLLGGRLKVLALFDKPDPLDGPYFEETIYVTPSRLPATLQGRIARETERGAAALGLREGPLHAELRVSEGQPCIVEIAARSIGGLCSDTLAFSGGRSLEELILLHATGADLSAVEREPQPSGVLMLPIPHMGVLTGIGGVEEARAVPGIVELTISVPLGETVVPLPEGNRYLGFVFARAETPQAVEAALRAAHVCLDIQLEAKAAVAGAKI